MALSILFVHNAYLQRGGEDAVLDVEAELLRSRGQRVAMLLFDNNELPPRPGPLTSLKLAAETIWSRKAQKRLEAAIEEHRPDVVHFHNTLPQVSPAAYRTAKQRGAAVVQMLHNFRLVCPSGLMYRDGRPCESCVGQALPLPGVVHGCYRGSRAQTAAVAAMLGFHRAIRTWERDVDLYLSPSEFLKSRLVRGGCPKDKIFVKPNFVWPDPGAGMHDGDYVLFISRLTETKGVDTLLQAYANNPAGLPPLRILNDGELAPRVVEAASKDPRIAYLGNSARDEVLRMMGEARALILPSTWYENFPMSVVEAFARGLPVIASRLGALPEIIQHGLNGALFEAGDAAGLAARLRALHFGRLNAIQLGLGARWTYEQHYTPDRAYEQLLTAYACAGRRESLAMKQRPTPHVI
jgi:glycosyltransferase involved in cell wall biosynthesis